MRRRLLNLLTAVSLLVCVAACVLWGSSYRYIDEVHFGRVPFSISVFSQQGLCRADWTARWPGHSYGLAGRHKALRPKDLDRGSGYFLRECGTRAGPFGAGEWVVPCGNTTPGGPDIPTPYAVVVAPHWALALVAAVLPASRFLHRRHNQRRARAGLCRSCGYDMRATPGRCPECGTTAESRGGSGGGAA